jgi:penicillin-binding protein 1A
MFRAPPLAAAPAALPLLPVHPGPPDALSAGRRGRRRGWLRLLAVLFILSVWLSLALFAAVLVLAWDLPRPETALDAARRPSLTLETSASTVGADRVGGERVFATYGDVVGEPLRLADLPAYLPAAVVAVEDRRFYAHGGLDPLGIARAIVVNLSHGRLLQGGSTITQQVAKNLFLSNTRTLRRKVQEALLTLWLERSFTKQEILEIWLNRVYLGSGAYGVDAAAHLYFGVSARHVALWQAAVLAGLARAPSRLSPRVDPAAAAARAREVLAAMVETGAITPAQASDAAARIAFRPRPPTEAGWFADWAAEEAETLIDPGVDAVVHTTLDPRLQAVAETRLDAMLATQGLRYGVSQGAVVALDAQTGAVRAMVGGRDYHASPYNRAVAARRQPGSAFKPFVWLAALEKGARPDDVEIDAPLRLGDWSPQNFDGIFRGQVSMETALADSLNTVAVRLLLQAGGPRDVAETAHRLGISDPLPEDDTLALGTGEVGLLELTAAYAAFANGGMRITPTAIASIDTVLPGQSRQPVQLYRLPPPRVIAPEAAAMMARMLRAVVERGSGQAAKVAGREAAGKTGTTQDGRDAWFVGWSGGLLIGVWMGNDDDRPTKGLTGGALPARLFGEIAAAE